MRHEPKRRFISFAPQWARRVCDSSKRKELYFDFCVVELWAFSMQCVCVCILTCQYLSIFLYLNWREARTVAVRAIFRIENLLLVQTWISNRELCCESKPIKGCCEFLFHAIPIRDAKHFRFRFRTHAHSLANLSVRVASPQSISFWWTCRTHNDSQSPVKIKTYFLPFFL